VWFLSWPLAGAAMVVWATARGLELGPAVAAAVLLLGLGGVLGPPVVRPVGVDLPAMALALWSVAFLELGWWPAAVACIAAAAACKETTPVFAALWAWHPLLLVGLLLPAVRAVRLRGPEIIDRVTATPELRAVHDHPVATALAAHAGRWRDAWLMVVPWGATVAALYRPTPAVVAVLVVAHLQLLVATDTVRLLHTAAGPAVALAAAGIIPQPFLLLAVVLHLAFWRKPELI
jgi:hypothetical protein